MDDNARAWVGAFQRIGGIRVEPAEYLRLEGAGTRVVAETILAAHGVSGVPAEDVVAEKERLYLADHRFALYPGIEELLDELAARRIRLALVTGANRARLERTAPAALLARFQAIVTTDRLTRGKPEPDPFLKAMEDLRSPPGECIAVENAPLGVASAKSAGAACIAITTTVSAETLAGADEVVADHAELAQRLKRLTERPS